MSGQPRNALVKQLIYGLIGFCVLTGIVFGVIYPEGKLSFWGAVFISMTVVAAFGSPVLLVVALILSSSRKHEGSGDDSGGWGHGWGGGWGDGGGGDCGGGDGGGGGE